MTPGSFLLAGNDKVAVLSSGYTDSGSSVTAVNTNGSQVAKKFNQPLNGWSTWSPDGKHLVVAEGSVAIVLDASLNQVASLPRSSVIAYPTWLNNSVIFYGVGSQLWSYNLTNQKSYVIANMPFTNPIKEITVSDDRAYVYVTSFDNSGAVAVRRVGLKDQEVPDYVYRLQQALPLDFQNYSINLINFALPPTILVEQKVGTPPTDYISQAKHELQARGFDVSKLRFTLVQGNGS